MGGFVRRMVKTFTRPSSPIRKVQPAAVKAAPKGPTKAEMIATKEEDAKKILLANKRKGRKAQQLTGATGLEEETYLSKKSMLG